MVSRAENKVGLSRRRLPRQYDASATNIQETLLSTEVAALCRKKKPFLDDSTYLNLHDSEIKENDEF